MDFQIFLGKLSIERANELKMLLGKSINQGLSWVEEELDEFYRKAKDELPVDREEFYSIFITAHSEGVVRKLKQS